MKYQEEWDNITDVKEINANNSLFVPNNAET